MKKTILTLILTAALLPFAASAQNVKFEEYDLDNGLHVILSQNHKTPNVVISVMYHRTRRVCHLRIRGRRLSERQHLQ